MNGREAKTCIIAVCLTACYFVFGTAGLGVRARTDETNPIVDIRELSEGAHLGPLEYPNGFLYQLGSGMLLRVTGLDHWAMQQISLYIGALALGCIILAGIAVYEQDNQFVPFGWVPFAAALFVFSSALLRLLETSHISYTFTFFSLGILTISRSDQMEKHQSNLLLLIIFISMLSTNAYWALYYGGILVLLILMVDDRGSFSTITLIPFIFVFGIPPHTGQIGDVLGYYLGTGIGAILGVSEPHRGTTAGGRATEQISGWPITEVFGVTISSWYFYMSGVFIVACIAAVGGMFVLHHIRKRETLPTPGRVYLVFGGVTGFILVFLIGMGDASTLKRVILLPGAFGVLWVSVYLQQHMTARSYRLVAVGLCILLLVTTIPASNRLLLDGDGTPYDHFADENQVEKVEWASEYHSNCLAITAQPERHVPSWVGSDDLRNAYAQTGPPQQYLRVYDSGADGELLCNKAPPDSS